MKKKQEYEYVLTLTSNQAKEIQNALEAIMRWKLRQPELMVQFLPDRLNWKPGVDFDDCLARRNAAKELLKGANDLMCPFDYGNGSEKPLKDEQWHREYGIIQVIRHAIWEAENDKKNWCVDGDKPMQTGMEPLPEIEWREKNGTKSSGKGSE